MSVKNKTQVGDKGIDGRIFPVSALDKAPAAKFIAPIKHHECSGQISDHARTYLLTALLFTAIQVMAQPAQTLEQTKIAADAGDAAAQDKLAEKYIMRLDTANAELWYRKAANQGYAHAQGRLGDMLLHRSKMSIGIKPENKAALEDEALKWLMLAAAQGDAQGQADMASIFMDGKLVKQDFIEAYKWGDLAAANGGMMNPAGVTGYSIRDAAILKMSAEQIAEAKKRVIEFKPHVLQKNEIPEAAWVKDIKLKGITESPNHPLAIINNQVFEKGEQNTIKVDGKTIKVKCVEIGKASVHISIEGIEGERELQMSQH